MTYPNLTKFVGGSVCLRSDCTNGNQNCPTGYSKIPHTEFLRTLRLGHTKRSIYGPTYTAPYYESTCLKMWVAQKCFGGSFLYRNSVKSLPPRKVPGRIQNKRGLISIGLTNFSASPISNKEPVRSVWSKEKSQIMALYKQGFTADQYSWKPELRNNFRWDSSVELQKNVQLFTRWYIGQTRKDRHNLGTIRPFLLHSKCLKWKAATLGQEKASRNASYHQK
jgi:hypothetical protein